ncbi:phosphatase PAP2 family protein [Streptacidiphilus jiangxiensis]|uniref:Undecaprenyl-diphosphatase n=1 Tax=Streptacidiphilus jiangxiensis TaxID=235985 RepID=A0A1H7Y120_STRJI|nr:phosphatase PAP2 family protein [Streptacidiphilus jiangxiensis]SEM39048.1 undecaprenyl-diphosphatase [Streptacidiphilus jiangxiensis]
MVTLLADGGGGGSLDWSLVSAVNGLATSLPQALDSALAFLGEYGVPLGSVLLLLAAWARARRGKGAPVAVAGVLWAGLAAGMALLLNLPVRAMVQRPRPFVSHPGQLDLLMSHQANGSFASDHATFTMALAVGLLLVDRRLGLVGIALAFFEGFLRVFMGVHYPSDVLGGFALGTATVLLLAPVAMAVLTPFTHALTRTALRPLVTAPKAVRSRAARTGNPAETAPEEPPHDLAA